MFRSTDGSPAGESASRRWALAVIAAAIVLPSAGLAAQTHWYIDDRAVNRELAEAAREIGLQDRALAEFTPRLRVAMRARATAAAVVQQPDWSILLAVLATRMGNDVVLGSLHLESPSHAEGRPGQPAGPSQGRDDALTLSIHGLAREQSSVTMFIGRLQETHLFEDIKLLRTDREPYLDGQAVAFDVRCRLMGAENQP